MSLSTLLVQSRFSRMPPESTFVLSFFKDKPTLLLTFATFIMFWGIFVPYVSGLGKYRFGCFETDTLGTVFHYPVRDAVRCFCECSILLSVYPERRRGRRMLLYWVRCRPSRGLLQRYNLRGNCLHRHGLWLDGCSHYSCHHRLDGRIRLSFRGFPSALLTMYFPFGS